ncbi:chaperone modulatory protein CbpM [Alteromonadaceae bacterium Bs31]|nr:chaperone modulatory protein CbpM [Alteromonadaceae bacterium Bs31]
MTEALFSISFKELCQVEGIESELIVEIVEYGIVTPLDKNTDARPYDQWLFDTGTIHWIKKALRLRQDLEIDWLAIAFVIDLMRQKETLQKENELYRRQLKRFTKINPASD